MFLAKEIGNFFNSCSIIKVLSSAHRVGGGDFMIIIELIVSIIAQVAGYYLCKWLNRRINNDDN